MAHCPNQKRNLGYCNCTYHPCSRKGICCECVVYHRNNGQVPACFFASDAEKSYDRSIENFLKSKK